MTSSTSSLPPPPLLLALLLLLCVALGGAAASGTTHADPDIHAVEDAVRRVLGGDVDARVVRSFARRQPLRVRRPMYSLSPMSAPPTPPPPPTPTPPLAVAATSTEQRDDTVVSSAEQEEEEDASSGDDLVKLTLKGATTLAFLSVGDWGCGSNMSRTVASAMADYADVYEAAFVVSPGDNFYQNGVESLDDPRWQTHFEDIFGVNSTHHDGVLGRRRFYTVLGNHDYRGNVTAQLAYRDSKLGKTNWYMPSTYYSEAVRVDSHTTMQLVFLDTNALVAGSTTEQQRAYQNPVERANYDRARKVAGEQIRWLDHTLAQSRAHWLVVIGHHPVFSVGTHGNTPAMLDQVYPLLNKYEVDLYVAGHDHNLQLLQSGDVDYFVSGSGCKLDRPESLGDKIKQSRQARVVKNSNGFMLHEVSRESLKTSFVSHTGEILHLTSRSARRNPLPPSQR